MSTNYIELYHNDNILTAKIHKNGKVRTLRNPNNIKKLLSICHKHNKMFNGNKLLNDNVDPIINEFDKYYDSISKRRKRLQILIETIDNIVLKKESKATGKIVIVDTDKKSIKETIDSIKKTKQNNHITKIVIASSLAATLGISYFNFTNNKEVTPKFENFENQVVLEENIDYIDENLSNFSALPTVTMETEEPVIEEETSVELDTMLQSDQFHFSYEDRSNYENVTNAKRYEDIFERYATRYGVDKNLLMAIAAQENCGKHYEALNSTYATGIMQIERGPNIGSTISAYNFETGQMDQITITQDAIENLETNIQIGTMIIRNKIEEYDYNIPLSIQGYNFGAGNMANSIAMCSDLENVSKEEIKSNVTDPLWLNYRQFLGVGDPQYVEHIFSFIPSNTIITVKDRDGNDHSIQIVNDNVNTIQMT